MKKKIRVLIVENEYLTIEMLRDNLEESGYHISGDAMEAEEAIEILERFDTDIVMLDINLNGEKDGIWLAEQIRQNYQIPFIFVSAYSDSATVKRAAKTSPYGYLVKPFTQADIFVAIEVALQNYAKELKPFPIPAQNWTNGNELLIHQSIFVKDEVGFKKVVIAEIRYVQAFKNYTEINVGNEKIIIRSTFQKFIAILPQEDFVQIHRSFVVNAKYVEGITLNEVIIGGEKIPLSKTYKEDFIHKFNFFI